MSDHKIHPDDILGTTSDHVNAILDKADSLLKRRRPRDAIESGTQDDAAHDADLPILTDVNFVLPPPARPAETDKFERQEPSISFAPPPSILPARIAEHLIALDTQVAKIIQDWLTRELPHHLNQALEKISEDLRTQTLAHAQATLLPTVSEKIAQTLDAIDHERIPKS